MQGYQFCHVETWSAAGATGSIHHEGGKRANGQKSWTAAEILDEAERRPGSAFHVERGGERPQILPGAVADFDGLRAAHAAAASVREEFDYTDPKTGRKSTRRRGLRKDARSLYTCVFSLPVEADDVRRDPWRRAEYLAILEAAIAHERDRIEHGGGCYMMSVVHWDEKHLHAHLFALDPVRGRVNHLHPGVAAKQAFVDDPRNAVLSKKDRNAGGNRAYCDAMRDWQNTLHDEVFKDHGLLRIGPRRERLSRADWQQAKTAAAERIEDAERQRYLRARSQDLAEFETTMAEIRAEDIAAQRAWDDELEARSRELDEAQADIGARWRATVDREVEQEAREAKIGRREAGVGAAEARLSAQAEALAGRERKLRGREAEAEAAMAVIDAIADGAAELVEVGGEPRLRPSAEPAKAVAWAGLRARIGAAPAAARRMMARVRDRLDRMRPAALEEARRELRATYDRASALWDGAQRVYAELTGIAERLPPEDRRRLEAIRGEMQRAAGSKAILSRDLRTGERDNER